MSTSEKVHAANSGSERTNWTSLDGLRGWAILFVVAVHLWAHSSRQGGGIPIILHVGASSFDLTWIFATGHNAVAVFFVLSGFLLYRHWRERGAGMRMKIQLSKFFEARMRRILPGFILFLFFIFYWCYC